MKRIPTFARQLIFGLLVAALIGGIAPRSPETAYAAYDPALPVWRVQITLQTANVSNAGTDDSVSVELNASNRTWLDYARNDFERGDSFTYDLDLSNVSKLGDINMIRISKTGSDGWCIQSFTLLVNGRSAYSRNFGSSSSTCHWLDNENGHTRTFTVSSATLVAAFGSFVQPFPSLVITHGEIESRVQGMIGNYLHGTPLYWGHLHGRGVEASYHDPSSVHIDLDLAYSRDYWFDPEVDVDFDLYFSCIGGQLAIETRNVRTDVDSSILSDILSLGIVELVDGYVNSRIQSSFHTIAYTVNLGVSFCPDIAVQPNGDVAFSLPSRPAAVAPLTAPVRLFSDGTR